MLCESDKEALQKKEEQEEVESIRLTGCVKNISYPPIITALLKLVSACFPGTIPNTMGAQGYPYYFRIHPAAPNPIHVATSKKEYCTAKLPIIEMARIADRRTFLGITVTFTHIPLKSLIVISLFKIQNYYDNSSRRNK